MHITQIVVVALLSIGAVWSQSHPFPGYVVQDLLVPYTSDGFDTVILDDLSFATELSFQSWGPGLNNVTYYVYGDSALRTIYPGELIFSVGSSPIDVLTGRLPFIDFHTFQDTDGYVWGFGPISSIYYPPTVGASVDLSNGVKYQLGLIWTRPLTVPGNSKTFDFPVGLEGIFHSVRVDAYNPQLVVAYFAGFFNVNPANPLEIAFGVYRTTINVNQLISGQIDGTAITYNNATDIAVVYNKTALIPYNAAMKPILLHMWSVANAPVNATYLAVVEPYFSTVNVVTGNWDHSIPLMVNHVQYRAGWDANGIRGRVVSAVSWQNYIFVGVAASGNATGWIDILDVNSPALYNGLSFNLPPHYSNPQALVIDWPRETNAVPVMWVGCNGGAGIIKLNIDLTNGNLTIAGYQALPFYLHRVWVGAPGKNHIYFATNEQHAKVFRIDKADVCESNCPKFGFCRAGKCHCDNGFDLKEINNEKVCEWHTLVVETTKEKRYHGGEVALGVFFTLSFLAAVLGWFLVWRNRRSQYHAV